MGAKADAKGDNMSNNNNTHAILDEYVYCIVYCLWLNKTEQQQEAEATA